jgi:hypothetical protein
MTAVAFLASEKCEPFAELSDGTYRYLRSGWESRPDPLRADGPDAGWVRRGLERGDVIRNGLLSETALFLLNRRIAGA